MCPRSACCRQDGFFQAAKLIADNYAKTCSALKISRDCIDLLIACHGLSWTLGKPLQTPEMVASLAPYLIKSSSKRPVCVCGKDTGCERPCQKDACLISILKLLRASADY